MDNTLNLSLEQGSPEIVQELIDVSKNNNLIEFKATSEWQEIPEIVKLTFKGVCHVLRFQHEAIE
jgi:hypothetical protein